MTPDPWLDLRRHTPARIALGSSGNSLPTAEWLRFGVAHAQARDAVHRPLDVAQLHAELAAQGFETIDVESAAADRSVYLRRPDLGRRLSARSVARLRGHAPAPCDLLCVVGDGLSAGAVQQNAAALLQALRPRVEAAGFKLGPVLVASQARVALGDAAADLLQPRAVLVLIGERPGLSSPDSMGAYFTWQPRTGRQDSERNCVSNIRPAGLATDEAARKLAWLVAAAERLGCSGIGLKDGSDDAVLAHEETPGRPKLPRPPRGASWTQPGPGGAHQPATRIGARAVDEPGAHAANRAASSGAGDDDERED